MKKTSETIVFFGNERLATGISTSAPTLQALVQANYNVAAVVSNYAEPQSRNSRSLEVGAVAQRHDIPLLLPARPLDVRQQLESLQPDIGVLVAYGKIVPQEIIDIFPRGIVNIHPSLLPLHRGPTPVESAILNGDSETGVSLMKLVKAMDAGPVFAQSRISLNGGETKQLLASELLERGKDSLIKHLPAILDGTLTAPPQDERFATYNTRINKKDGIINWQKSAENLEREVRAFSGWPKSRTMLAGKEIVVTKAHVVKIVCAPGQPIVRGRSLLVGTKHNALSIDLLIPAGKKEMTAAAFLAGYGRTLGSA